MMGIHEIVALLSPASSGIEVNTIIRYLCTDSRQISFPEETLFIALTSPRRNGHLYIAAAYERGIRHFIVSEDPIDAEFPGALFVKVPDTLAALQTLAAFHRQKYSLPVIGITGSNGKTIIKEWLYQLLSPDKNICRSPRSYNSQIGVPLSVWQLNSHHQLGIFEAGISTTGEMQKLQSIIRPTLGIFTTLGSAHDEGFTSREEKIHEKWNLFRSCGSVICRIDDELTRKQALTSGLPIISWGFHPEAIYHIHHIKREDRLTVIGLLHGADSYDFAIPFTDDASVENALHVVVTCLHEKMPADVIRERLQGLHALHMRLEWKKGINNSLLLNDSYSYDLSSLEIALNQLKQQAGNSKLMAILSDLPGIAGEAAYQHIAHLLAQKGVLNLVGVGSEMAKHQSVFTGQGISTQWFPSTSSFLEEWDRQQVEKTTFLVKGGRVFEFEKIAAVLQQQQHETQLEISLSALGYNLNSYRALLKPGTKLMVMLKAFGYGSTDAELGRWLQHHGVDYLTVAYTDEGVALRQGGVHLPIMVMNPEPASFETLVSNRLEPELFSTEMVKAFEVFASGNAYTDYPVHLKLDTGMHRLGFLPGQADELVQLLQASSSLKVSSVFTHLVASENPEHDGFTYEQAGIFDTFCSKLAEALPYTFLKHAANTAAIVRHPSLHYDMVRLGIGFFGVVTPGKGALHLQPATRLITTVAQVKEVKKGQTVGYGRHAILDRDSRIATVRIGYADGYRRQLGNGFGSMWIHNNRAPVVGNVCMDMTMLDVTDVPGVQPGHKVEVFGLHTSVGFLAQLCGTIPYEIMTGISQRVKRVLVDE
jgi:Alr-MurF fusion protein